MRDNSLPLIIFLVLSALPNYTVFFLRWMGAQGAMGVPLIHLLPGLFQQALSFITAAY